MQILEREWRVDAPTAKESYASLAKSFSKDGAASDAGLKVHINQIQRADKTIGDIPINKIVDFRPLEEVRREMIKEQRLNNALGGGVYVCRLEAYFPFVIPAEAGIQFFPRRGGPTCPPSP